MLELMQTNFAGHAAKRRARDVRPCIKSNFCVEIVEPKHVYLLSEHASHALTGRLYCAIVPVLNGQHTVEEIYGLLSEAVGRDHIDHVLDRLRRLGYLSDEVDRMPPGVAAFWSELGFEPSVVEPYLRQRTITLRAVGDVNAAPLDALLSNAGLTVECGIARKTNGSTAASPELQVVVTDDYLRPELADINRAAVESGGPWMIVKPVGSVIWLGPVFMPGKTGCWQCLAQRLSGNAEIKSSILRQRGARTTSPACLPTSRPSFPPTVEMALNWATTEIAKWVVAQSAEVPEKGPVLTSTLVGKILTLDHVTHECLAHALPRRPQCPCCGDPSVVSRRGFQPINLKASPKRYVDDGGHRSMTPEQTLEHYGHLLSPVSGVVTELTRISDPKNPLVHTYKASHSMGTVGSLRGLRQVLRHKSSGKGKTDAQSRASGFCEAIERYSFIYQGDEPRRQATLTELGDKAIHPANCLHFSEVQYANRDELNTESIGHDWIPMRFDADRSIEWTPVWSVTHDCHRFLPTAYCYLWYKLPKDHDFCRADSNGNAAGNTLEEAILQGFLEVVERDSVAIWWYNGLQRPLVDLASFGDPYFQSLEKFYRDIGREMWVLDLTSDLNIPVMAAVSRKIKDGAERLIVGYGAHLDPAVAITRALTELSQVGLELDKIPDERIDPESAEWLLRATLENKPYLVPDPSAPARQSGDFKSRWTDDIRDDVLAAVAAARQHGLEVLVLDLTRPDIGLNVVKVVVPGMRFFWQRFAPGRLYDVPVEMGWLTKPTPESGLNRTQMPF
jgi:bacteriocin biosynthesis cyclodehydratase domain-containing protein